MRPEPLDFIMNISKFHSVLSKRLDAGLGGIGFNDFVVLYHLDMAENNKLRRIDLAEKVGLTASGITRLLLPMEKIGLISKELNQEDARVSLVSLAPGGKRKLEEALERFDFFADEVIGDIENLSSISKTLQEIGGKMLWK